MFLPCGQLGVIPLSVASRECLIAQRLEFVAASAGPGTSDFAEKMTLHQNLELLTVEESVDDVQFARFTGDSVTFVFNLNRSLKITSEFVVCIRGLKEFQAVASRKRPQEAQRRTVKIRHECEIIN